MSDIAKKISKTLLNGELGGNGVGSSRHVDFGGERWVRDETMGDEITGLTKQQRNNRETAEEICMNDPGPAGRVSTTRPDNDCHFSAGYGHLDLISAAGVNRRSVRGGGGPGGSYLHSIRARLL